MRTAWVIVVAIFTTLWHGGHILVRSFFGLGGLQGQCRCRPRLWARGLLWAAGVKVEFQGLENLGEGRQIVVANHESWFDVLALSAYLPMDYRFVAKKELEGVPIFGPAWQACGHISIDRDDRTSAIESLEEAARQIRQEDATIIMFPEGTRSDTGEIASFKKGAFVLAIQAGAPVVPVGIDGSREVMAKRRWRIRPRTIHVRVGRPMQVDGLTHADRDQLTREARRRVAYLKEGREPTLPVEGGGSAGTDSAEAWGEEQAGRD
jgi:1-acyl-sn-glycerol-3-phosphate acyltransferase